MSPVAALFPGQGSQHVGMGIDLLDSDPRFVGWIQMASELTHADLGRILRRGPERELARTDLLQPLLVCVCLGYYRRLVEGGLVVDLVAGHSLGELCALVAAGVLTAEAAIRLAIGRGSAMQRAALRVDGGMVAVTGSQPEEVMRLSLGSGEPIWLANDNAPNQQVFAGESGVLRRFVREIAQVGAGMCRALAVSGPWHTPLMRDAQEEFGTAVREEAFAAPVCQWFANVTGGFEVEASRSRELLVRSVTEPVQWRKVMSNFREIGVGTLVEVGPGRVLSGLARANGLGLETSCYSVNSLRSVEAYLNAELSRIGPGPDKSPNALRERSNN